MRRKKFCALAVFGLILAGPATARAESPARQDFNELMHWVRLQAPGARVATLYSVIDPDGGAKCWPKGGRFYDGWEMIFQGAPYRQWMVMGCRTRKLVRAYLSPFPVIEKDFIGIDEVLSALSKARVVFPPGAPIRATLAGSSTPGANPAWTLQAAGRTYRIDAYTGSLLGGPASIPAAAAPPAPPKR